MAGLDEALERLINDKEFREALQRDAEQTLAGYDLSPDERAVLAAQLNPDAGTSGRVEQRTSKTSTIAALTGAVADALGSPELTSPPDTAEEGWPSKWKGEVQQHDSVVPTETVSFNFVKVEPGDAGGPSDLAAPGKPEELILPAPEDVVAPPGDPQASPGSTAGKWEWGWKVEEGVKSEGELGMTAGSVDTPAPTEKSTKDIGFYDGSVKFSRTFEEIEPDPGADPGGPTDLESPAGGPSNKEEIARFEVEVD